ncbi:GDA1 Guanosine-diphosphatase [Candida maltosa Xu316]
MLNTRNVRLIVAVIGLFGIFAFFASSQHSLVQHTAIKQATDNTKPIDKIQPPPQQQQESVQKEVDEDEKNTLQGLSHSGTKPPYEIDDTKANDKVLADTSLNANKDNTDTEIDTKKKPALNEQTIPQDDDVNENCSTAEYVVMVDAGSTGSRVHVYEFNTCIQPPKLIKETFEMLKPGLSSFDTDVVGAAKSLDPLLKIAMDTVPVEKQKQTPIAVKATAGLRLLGEEKSTNTLNQVKTHLQTNYPFKIQDISVITGEEEASYSWFTINYLLGNIGGKEKVPTAAVFDLGGGSTQIVYEVDKDTAVNDDSVDGLMEYTYGDASYKLYQNSYLGFGLMSARQSIIKLLMKEEDAKQTTKDTNVEVVHPCLAPGAVATDVVVNFDDAKVQVNVKGPATKTEVAECRKITDKVFSSFKAPNLSNFANEIYLISYFFDRTIGSVMTIDDIVQLSKLVDLSDPMWALDLNYISSLLTTGYNIASDKEIKTAKTINDNEVGWCLGASLFLLKENTK